MGAGKCQELLQGVLNVFYWLFIACTFYKVILYFKCPIIMVHLVFIVIGLGIMSSSSIHDNHTRTFIGVPL